jgi:uncharacterized FlaG/YvyC family protein
MSPPLTRLSNAIVHQEDAVSGLTTTSKLNAHRSEPSRPEDLAPAKSSQLHVQEHSQQAVSLSFAFDSLTQSLNVIMTDKNSGEVVRKFSYKSLAADVHKTEKLTGLLLDQLV